MTRLPAMAADQRLGQVSIRRATMADREAIATLARLDGAPPPNGDGYLLAEEDGALRAARPLAGGTAIADPFHQTEDLVAMLELRAARMVPDDGASRGSTGLRSLALRRHSRGARRPAASPVRAAIPLSGSALRRT